MRFSLFAAAACAAFLVLAIVLSSSSPSLASPEKPVRESVDAWELERVAYGVSIYRIHIQGGSVYVTTIRGMKEDVAVSTTFVADR
jgi:hypothetical protein